MRRLSGCLLLLLLPVVALAELRVEGDAKIARDRMARLKAVGAPAGSFFIWDVSDEGSLDVEEAGERLLVCGRPGTYRVKLRSISIEGGKAKVETARFTLTIGDGAPPAPPVPPAPPDDPLLATLKAAYEQDKGPDSSKHAKALAALYRQAPAAMEKVDTAGKLQAALKVAAASLVPAAALPNTRKAVSVELKAVLPVKADEPLGDEHRQRARSLFGRLAACLEVLK